MDKARKTTPTTSRKVRRRSRRRTRVRSKTIAPKRLTKEELRMKEILEPYKHIPRPKTRAECANGIRPCPFVSCRHHLYLDVNEEKGSLKINFPDLHVWELTETCSLDVADRGGIESHDRGPHCVNSHIIRACDDAVYFLSVHP